MAAVEPMDELKECLRASVEMLLDKLNDRLHEDMDGVDYLCVQLDRIQNLIERASGLYDIPSEIVDILQLYFKKCSRFVKIISDWKERVLGIQFYRLSLKTVFSYFPRYAAIILRLSVFFLSRSQIYTSQQIY